MIRYDPANPWTVPAAGHAQPGLTNLLGYLIATYGGSSNGIFVDRPMRGSSRPSLHRDGRACDWLQPDDKLRAQGAAFCAANADLLQVQEIHRYKESLAWNPTESWHHATGEAFGEPWANWIHVERNLEGSADTRPITEIIYVEPPQLPKVEDDMIIQLSDTGAYYQISGTHYISGGLQPQSLGDKYKAAGVPIVKLTTTELKANYHRLERPKP